MNNTEAQDYVNLFRNNLMNSATPNMELAIKCQAPIAALLYGLALIDTMSGFFYGAEARKSGNGEGVGKRYNEFIKTYLSPGYSGCDYKTLDLYKSLRCNMAHSLTPGHLQKGKFDFELRQDAASNHGSKKTAKTIIFDVPTFCKDVLHAADTFLNDVEKAMSQSQEPTILTNFKAWWDEGYSILVSN